MRANGIKYGQPRVRRRKGIQPDPSERRQPRHSHARTAFREQAKQISFEFPDDFVVGRFLARPAGGRG